MTDPLSLASGLVALVEFAFQTSKSLYEVIKSFQSTKRAIRELRFEVESLNQALATLKTVAVDNEAQFIALKLPVLRCGTTCKEFEGIINKYTRHSHDQRTSFRDWAKLRYMGSDITDLRTTIAGYKATINIALGGATFRQVAVTVNVLEEYKQMTAEAISDLQDHLQGINEQAKSIEETYHTQHSDIDLSIIREEKESTEQCLAICIRSSGYIEGAQIRLPQDSYNVPMLTANSTSGDGFDPTKAYSVTDALSKDLTDKVSLTHCKLQARLSTVNSQLKEFSEVDILHSQEGTARLDLIREERENITQCLNICADALDILGMARENIYKDVTSAEDSHQLVVSTIGDLISAKYIRGAGSMQLLGQMPDNTLEQLLQDQKTYH
ncbi:hypothetical protein BDV26DRAFT_271361 [Aspergillus bertholletiae]|uniref:Azaphilone pigments biosynthesis cluster protein L N-terminal domain-containing protein n=1 Tax=Aspergillus bertholletiae TaxID=1226010 RepID=A0A5N7AV93_9EURO|nr:hypothetical protein BDV26DRAFT_271361 [Aspergillus bertholletiae]